MVAKHLTKPFLNLLFFVVIAFFNLPKTYAQGPPPLPQRTITVSPTQTLSFGTFYISDSNAAFIVVGPNGFVTSKSANVFMVSSVSVRPAIFEVKLCQGRDVTITLNTLTALTNSSVNLTLSDLVPDKAALGVPFQVESNCTFITTVRVGGKLTIPAGAINGVYNGSFSLDFAQQ